MLSLQSDYLLALVDCSTLDSSIDQKACQSVLADSYTPYSDAKASSWLNSVQKIPAGTPITEELLANPNRLYIFDHQTADGERAVYHFHFSSKIRMPADSVFISNGTAESKPLFLLEGVEWVGWSTEFAATNFGYNAVVNVEISSRNSDSFHQLFSAIGVRGLTLSGVTLSSRYTPPEESSISFMNLLSLGNGDGFPTDFRIENCDFLLPDLDPHKHEIRLYALMIVGNGVLVVGTPSDSSYHSTMFVTFKGNRIVSKDYNKSTSNKIIASALGVNGFVMLSGS
ncbi:MAG: hypothetical protein ACR2PT_18080, partial [Endozoicomonas sp.]